MDQKFIYILDAGHGGLVNGEYTTSGKRSPVWEDGSVYYEGVGNRDIRDRLARMLDAKGIKYHFTTVGGADTSLGKRVNVINALCDMYGASKCIMISIHSNGFNKPEAYGWSIYTTKGTTKSDAVATIISEEAKKEFAEEIAAGKTRSREDKRDGDVDKEANFYIIANARCRAVLSENFFMTNPYECKEILMTERGRGRIANAHYEAILRMEEEL